MPVAENLIKLYEECSYFITLFTNDAIFNESKCPGILPDG